MTHDLHEQLARYADNELDPRERAELEAQIAGSPEMAAEVERWKALRCCAGRAMRDCCASPGFEARLRDKVNHAGSFSGSRTYRIATFLAAAAAIVLFAIFWSKKPTLPGPGLAQAGALSPTDLVNVHELCAKNGHKGVKLQNGGCAKSAEAQATQACQGYKIAVPDLTSMGYKLAGMCRCLDETGVPGLHCYYQNDADPKELLSLFSISRCTPIAGCKTHCCKTERDYESTTIHGVTVLRWDELGGHFALVCELKPEALEKLAAGVQVAAAGPSPNE